MKLSFGRAPARILCALLLVLGGVLATRIEETVLRLDYAPRAIDLAGGHIEGALTGAYVHTDDGRTVRGAPYTLSLRYVRAGETIDVDIEPQHLVSTSHRYALPSNPTARLAPADCLRGGACAGEVYANLGLAYEDYVITGRLHERGSRKSVPFSLPLSRVQGFERRNAFAAWWQS